jgi:hypothetical protein
LQRPVTYHGPDTLSVPFSHWRYSDEVFEFVNGRVFQDLLQHGKDIEEAIARRDTRLLDNSTPELERYFSRPLSELPRQNPYPVAMLLPLFLVAFALNLSAFSQHVAGFVTFTSCIELFLTIIDDDRRAHCDKRTTGSWKDCRDCWALWRCSSSC